MMSACSGRLRVALGRRNPLDQLFEQLGNVFTGLRRHVQCMLGIDADDLLDFLDDLVGIGRGQIDLVEDRQHLEPLLERGVAVGHALRLHALRGIDHQQRALAGREAARDLVGEIDVARACRSCSAGSACHRSRRRTA